MHQICVNYVEYITLIYKALALIIIPINGIMITIAPKYCRNHFRFKWAKCHLSINKFYVSISILSISRTSDNLLNALGKSNIYLKIDIYKTIIGLIVLIISFAFWSYMLCWASYSHSIACIYSYVLSKKYLDLQFWQ